MQIFMFLKRGTLEWAELRIKLGGPIWARTEKKPQNKWELSALKLFEVWAKGLGRTTWMIN